MIEPKQVEIKRYCDSRGYFNEVFSPQILEELELEFSIVQLNQSYSRKAGTLRGMHAQRPPMGQAKLVTCLKGAIHDVVVDVRPNSSKYLQKYHYEIRASDPTLVYVPEGFLHGFVTLEDDTYILYGCNREYSVSDEITFRYDDPAFGIDWPLEISETLLSPKDLSATAFKKKGIEYE